MFDIERGFIGKQNLTSPIASLGQIADQWNPQRAIAERVAIRGKLEEALTQLGSGAAVPLDAFLGVTTGEHIDRDLAGR